MKLDWLVRSCQLSRPLTISRRHQTDFRAVFLSLQGEGVTGLGEAVPDPYFGETPEALSDAYRALRGDVENAGEGLDASDALLDAAERKLSRHRSALTGFDLAVHDWLGKKRSLPAWRILGLPPPDGKPISYCVSVGPLSEMIASSERETTFPIIKIKLGCPHDVEAVREIRRRTPARLRLDPNAAWTEDEAMAKLNAIGPERIDFVEQPVPPGNPDSLDRIRRRTGMPVLADESVRTSADLPALRGRVDGINIKLMKCGGLQEAVRMIAFARDAGWRIMVGCRIETSLAITAAAHLSGAVDDLDLDGHLFLAADPFRGVTLENGRLMVPAGPGLGVVEAAG